MLKYILIFTSIVVFFHLDNTVFANVIPEKPIIIPRASWWENSLYNDRNWKYWTSILESHENYTPPYIAPEILKARQEKTKKINNYLNENFSSQFTSEDISYYKNDNSYRYAWPLKYTSIVDAIVIHHTDSEYENSLTGMQDIHRYHSINRQWWDIWYQYVIWYEWEIFEWREWWDYVVWAHSKYNNFWTVGIAILGNYQFEWANEKQYQSLESLVRYLTYRYGIDLSKKRYYHKTCSGKKCDTFPIETSLDSVLVGHRDATHTSCPWDKLYEQIQQLRENNLAFTTWFTAIKRESSISKKSDTKTSDFQTVLNYLKKYSKYELESIKKLIDKKLKEHQTSQLEEKLKIVRLAIILRLQKLKISKY